MTYLTPRVETRRSDRFFWWSLRWVVTLRAQVREDGNFIQEKLLVSDWLHFINSFNSFLNPVRAQCMADSDKFLICNTSNNLWLSLSQTNLNNRLFMAWSSIWIRERQLDLTTCPKICSKYDYVWYLVVVDMPLRGTYKFSTFCVQD